MKKSIVVDSSFLINLYLLGWFDILCKIYDEIVITPTVKRECKKIENHLKKMECVSWVELSKEEEKEVSKLLEEISKKFPGEHRGEIECVAVAKFRGIPLLISDNFAPWYLKERHRFPIEIERGHYVITEALGDNVLKREDLDKILMKIEGVYPKKAIDVIRKKFER